MSLITGSIQSIISIKIKYRHDSFSDQVSRIFVAKMFLVASLVMGVDWFHDTVFCVFPKNTGMSDDFIYSSCWIQGFYIYPEMENHMRLSAYYGIPQYAAVDGFLNGTKHLCRTQLSLYRPNKNCLPMRKRYFTHYQWMPFYVASFAIFFYLPYMLFRVVNTDMISLQLHLKRPEIHTKDIVENYFNHKVNSKMKMRFRILFNLIIKCLYVIVNVITFNMLNVILNNEFANYGWNFTKWWAQNSSMAMDFNKRSIPSPGNKMLPAFGFCDLHEIAMDGKFVSENQNKILCEISSNILYQYVLMVLWFVLVFAIFVSVLGMFVNVFVHLIIPACLIKRNEMSKMVYKYLTFRECEYLDYIRNKNLTVFGNVVRAILTRNCLLKSMIPLQLDANGAAVEGEPCERVELKENNDDVVRNIINSEPEDGPYSPGELGYFRKTHRQLRKLEVKDRKTSEKHYSLIDNLLTGIL